MKIYWNKQIVEEEQAVVSVYDHGFLYGMGLFETFRTYGGKPFLLQMHMDRLSEGCKELWLDYTPEAVEIEGLVAELLEANQLSDAYFRLSVSAGNDILGLPAGRYTHPGQILYVKSLPPISAGLQTSGKPLQLLQQYRNTPEGPTRRKSFHYMNNIMAKRELQQYSWAGQAEGVMVNSAGHLTEGIVSNLFFVKDGVCLTPSVDTGILPGVTRSFVIELLQRKGVPIHEGHFTWETLQAADEIFITNSIQEIVPVTALFDPTGQRTEIWAGTAGVLTQQLVELYRQEAAGRGAKR